MDALEISKILFTYEDLALVSHMQWQPVLYSLPDCVNPTDRQGEVLERLDTLVTDEESKEYYKNLILAMDNLDRVVTKHLIYIQSKYISKKRGEF